MVETDAVSTVRSQVGRGLRRGLCRSLDELDDRVDLLAHYPSRRNAVLMYHAIADSVGYENVSVERFRRDLRYVTRHYDVVDLPEVLSRRATEPKRVAITFDDAYATFYEKALPVIREFDVPVTVFVPTGFVGETPDELAYRFALSPVKTESFNDPRANQQVNAPAPDVVGRDQLQELASDDNVTLGSHTRTHPDLASVVDLDTAVDEIRGSKRDLENSLDVTVDRFCYPYGRMNTLTEQVVRESYQLAVTTEPRPLPADSSAGVDRYRIPRLGTYGPEAKVHCDLADVWWDLLDAVHRLGL